MKLQSRVGYLVLGMSFLLSACGPSLAVTGQEGQPLVIYSGRSENLVGPIIEQFEEMSGIDVLVRWGETPELAAVLLEEGANSPADIFFAQDPGGLGAVEELLAPLSVNITEKVKPRFSDEQGKWVGISGRARTVVYNTTVLKPEDLPDDLWGFTEPEWRGRLGWAPTNASFQTMITAMRATWGEEETRRWLEAIIANEPVVFDKNAPIVAAVGAGEIDAGFVNHYYLFRFLQEEGETFPARNYFIPDGGPGSLVMVAGAGVLESSNMNAEAEKFIEFLLSPVAQQYFATQTYEYPVIDGVVTPRELPPLEELNANSIGLSDLADLQGSVRLLKEVGALP